MFGKRVDFGLTVLLLASAILATRPLCAFQAYPAGTRARNTQRQPGAVYTEDLTATFTGTVRTNQGRILRVEDADNKVLEFHCTRKTGYFDGDRKIKASAVKPGVRVSIDAKQFPDGELEPVNVRVVHETQKKPDAQSGDDVLKP